MSIEATRIETIIKVHLAPELRAEGFTGSGIQHVETLL
jgi:hypothetical protein